MMPLSTHDRWLRAKDIFSAALQHPAERRESFARDQCGDDAALLDEVLSLLAAHRPADEGVSTISAPTPLTEKAGTIIGRYKLLQQIGEGGFGVVFLAEQRGPIHRKVALKIIKLGMDTRQVVARFDQERQALALMDHPHIARVFDGGATDSGRPYFVMEYVMGDPITDFADAHRLSVRDRLALIMQCCQAVQHAHHKGVIHRDIKPRNVLVSMVDGRPFAKVIDFGIAKATASRLTELTCFTEQGQIIGTLPYMSPEQAEGSTDVDTRTDVYSLGVLFYELLTGITPFEPERLIRAAIGEVQRIIREEEPLAPSLRISRNLANLMAIAAARSVEPARLTRLVRGELDWVAIKALEKDRRRRYETPSALELEIARFLNNEPLVAGPPSLAYRAKKFVSKHRVPVAYCAILAFAISCLTTWAVIERNRAIYASLRERSQRLTADKQRAAADQEREAAEALTDFIVSALVASDPLHSGASDTTVVDAMKSAADLLDTGDPNLAVDISTRLRLTIASVLNGQGQFVDALGQAQKAHDGLQSEHAEDHPLRAQSLHSVAVNLHAAGRADEALPKFESALRMRERLYYASHPDVITSRSNMAACLHAVGRTAEALAEHKAALVALRQLFPQDHREIAVSLDNIASCLESLGNSSAALDYRQQSLEMRQRLFNRDHPDLADSINNVGHCFESLGRANDALVQYRKALEMRERLFPADHPAVAASHANVGTCLGSLGQWSAALKHTETALSVLKRVHPGDHPAVATVMMNVALCKTKLDKPHEALPYYQSSLTMRQRFFKSDNPAIAQSYNNIASCLTALGREHESLAMFEAALAMQRRILPSDHPDIANTLNNLAHCVHSLGNLERATLINKEALDMRRRLYGVDHPDVALSLSNLGVCYRDRSQFAEALTLFRESLAMRERNFHGDHPSVVVSLNNVASCLRSLGRASDALPLYEAALAMSRRVLPRESPNTLYPQLGLARTLTALECFGEAESLLIDGAQQCDRSAQSHRLHWPVVLDALIDLYVAWNASDPDGGYGEKASEWLGRRDEWRSSTQPASLIP